MVRRAHHRRGHDPPSPVQARSSPLNPIIYTVMQERVPVEMRARVFGTVRSLAWMAMPLGPMVEGSAAQVFGLRAAYTVVAVL